MHIKLKLIYGHFYFILVYFEKYEICLVFSISFSMNANLIHYNSILFHVILIKNMLHYPESQISPTEDFLNILYIGTAAWFWGRNVPLPLAFYVCQNRPKCCDVFIWLYSQLWCTIQIMSVFHRKALERSQLCRLIWKSGLLKMHSRCGDGHRSGQLIWWRNSGYILGMSGLHVWSSRQKRECWPLLSLQSFWPQIFAASRVDIHIECACCAIQMKSFDTSTN